MFSIVKMLSLFVVLFSVSHQAMAQVQLLSEVKVTDDALFFDGEKVDISHTANSTTGYDYVYGTSLTPHGDCVKGYKNFVFMTWYRGGKLDRHVMLTRYNMETGVSKTIELPHQHTGYNGRWWIGETHNTISVGICPKDSSVHMLYDLHRNGNVTIDNIGTEDYLRYSFTEAGGATCADEDFTLDRFVNSPNGNYKHLSFNGIDNVTVTKLLTYPAFFTNDEGDLFLKNRFGYSENGRFLFARYDGSQWHGYTDFNRSSASNYGSAYNWGLYGDIKYLNGKIRVGFQQRKNVKTDRFKYQNGFFYAYCDDPTGKNQWKDYTGTEFSRPLAVSDKIKIGEPGDVVATTQTDMVYMVGGFDYTVTANEDVHFIAKVKDNENNVTKYVHTYKSGDDEAFTTSTDFSGAELLYAAGNDVYVIGLINNRVNIQKTVGGTNDFTTLYQGTDGLTFDKGVANIKDGKLYYYLKQRGGSGDKRTTYLQIYDLDIDETPADTSRYLSIKDLSNGQEFPRGTNLDVMAEVGSAYKEVSLFSGTTNLGTLTSAPFKWTLNDMTDRVYSLKLVAKDSADVTKERSLVIYTPEVFVLSDKQSLHISFEDEAVSNWLTDGNDYGVTPAIIDGTNTRAGSKVLALDYSDRTSGHHVQNIVDKIAVPNNHYFHMIAYTATSDIASGTTFPTAKLGDWAPTPGFSTHAENDVFQRKITSRQNTKGDSLNCAPRLRTKSSAGPCVVYYDDIVLYTSENASPDLIAPTSAQNLVVDVATISWTPGVDTLTGITNTLVLSTANASAEPPVLMPQASYSTADDNTSVSEVGDWTVIASLAPEATSYTDNSLIIVGTQYAIVHKDLAYNYSDALVLGSSSAVKEQVSSAFKCNGGQELIEITGLQANDLVTIYNISGVKVAQQRVTESTLVVNVSQGIYLVEVAGDVAKVLVK